MQGIFHILPHVNPTYIFHQSKDTLIKSSVQDSLYLFDLNHLSQQYQTIIESVK